MLELGSLGPFDEKARLFLSEKVALEKYPPERGEDAAMSQRWTESLKTKMSYSEDDIVFTPQYEAKSQKWEEHLNKNIDEGELQSYLNLGYECRSTLPSGKLVVRKTL
jgi:hypothetical protein